jgi:hypothetical protein
MQFSMTFFFDFSSRSSFFLESCHRGIVRNHKYFTCVLTSNEGIQSLSLFVFFVSMFCLKPLRGFDLFKFAPIYSICSVILNLLPTGSTSNAMARVIHSDRLGKEHGFCFLHYIFAYLATREVRNTISI